MAIVAKSCTWSTTVMPHVFTRWHECLYIQYLPRVSRKCVGHGGVGNRTNRRTRSLSRAYCIRYSLATNRCSRSKVLNPPLRSGAIYPGQHIPTPSDGLVTGSRGVVEVRWLLISINGIPPAGIQHPRQHPASLPFPHNDANDGMQSPIHRQSPS